MSTNKNNKYEQQVIGLLNAVIALLKAGVEDSHCYRNLIDNIAAYYMGSVNGTGKWDTRKIKERPECNWTIAAKAADKVEKEHVVPMSAIVRLLLEIDSPNPKNVLERIKKYAVYCIVTKDEHDLLNKDYQRTMPKTFWETKDELERNAFARYDIMKIKTIDCNRLKL